LSATGEHLWMLVYAPRASFIAWLTEVDTESGLVIAKVDLPMHDHGIPDDVLATPAAVWVPAWHRLLRVDPS
jgi:hypothetical protein